MRKNLRKKPAAVRIAVIKKMKDQFIISKADDNFREAIIGLLKSQKLPVEDLPSSLTNFLIAQYNNEFAGVIGFEQYDQFALLRSLAVHPDYRDRRIAQSLVEKLENDARLCGVTAIYLLTETASGYFDAKGYNIIQRSEVPEAIKQSSEFSHVCPQSAIVMCKSLSIQ